MLAEYNIDCYRKIITDSKALNKVGNAIKIRTFPIVVKNLGFSKFDPENTSEGFMKSTRPILQLADETFKTLPSLRHSSYQKYRNPSQVKDTAIGIDRLEVVWREETTMPSNELFRVDKCKRTQIVNAETLFGKRKGRLRSQERDIRGKEMRAQRFEKIFEEIKRRSERRASEFTGVIND